MRSFVAEGVVGGPLSASDCTTAIFESDDCKAEF